MSNRLLDPDYQSIYSLFNEARFNVPIYQRPYSWDVGEIDILLEDFWNSFTEYKKSGISDSSFSYYVGNIIIRFLSMQTYDVIDGQQRITSLTLLLVALYSSLKESKIVDDTEPILNDLKKLLWKGDIRGRCDKEKRIIELGSIEKDTMKYILDDCFSNPIKLDDDLKSFNTNSVPSKKLVNNYFRMKKYLQMKTQDFDKEEKVDLLLEFSNFVMRNICLISIVTTGKEIDVFSVFESINSKGKSLEDIDLIKTRIFQNLDEADYDLYLIKWGQLIIDTDDNLYDYLKIYIKAYIRYFRANITFKNFESLDNELCSHYGVDKLSDAYKLMIDDMIEKISYYKALFNVDEACKIIKDNRFRYYYYVFVKNKYEHPRVLFFRTLCDYNCGLIDSVEEVKGIIINTIIFSILFLSILGLDSKDAVTTFKDIFDNVNVCGHVDLDTVLYYMNFRFKTLGIEKNQIVNKLEDVDLYSSNKGLACAILAIYESLYGDDNKKISWDKAFSILSTYGSSYSLDHLLPQTPEYNDERLQYYNFGGTLKLKENADFPENKVSDGIDYNLFTKMVLNKIGNLDLKAKDGNASKNNVSLDDFNTYQHIVNRTENIANVAISNFLTLEKENPDYMPLKKKKNVSAWYEFNEPLFNPGNSSPVKVSFSGKEVNVLYHYEILANVVKSLYDTNPQKMLDLADDKWIPKEGIVISSDNTDLRKPFTIIVGEIYIEKNLSAGAVYELCGLLIDMFEADKDEYLTYYKWE